MAKMGDHGTVMAHDRGAQNCWTAPATMPEVDMELEITRAEYNAAGAAGPAGGQNLP